MEKFKELYGFYLKFPIADAGYGLYNFFTAPFCVLLGQHRIIRQRHFPEKKNYGIIVLSLSEELEFPCTIVYNTEKN